MKTQNQLVAFGKALALIATCLLFQNAHAQLFQEGFGYTAGNPLAGSVNPGSTLAWSGGNPGLFIGSGNLTYSSLANLGGNELSITNGSAGTSINQFANVTSGQVYYSFLLDVTTADGANDYITSLNPGTSAPNGGSDALAVYLYANNTIGIRTAGESTIHNSPTLSLDTTYFVVVDYDFATTTANLWLNPTAGDSQPSTTLSLAGSGTVTAIDDVGFKSQATTGDFLVDNLLIGTSWADVTPVPEPSVFALAGLGLLGLVSRVRSARRK